MSLQSEQLATARSRLSRYIAAETAVLENQSYSIKDRSYTMADLEQIRKEIKALKNEIAVLTNGGMRVRRFVPRDG